MKKPLYIRRAEAEAEKRTPAELAIQHLKAHTHRSQSGANTLLHLLRVGQLTPQNAQCFAYQPLVAAYLDLEKSKHTRHTAKMLIELVKVLARQKAEILNLPDNALKIKRMAEMMPAARRPLEEWRPLGKSANHKLISLQQHLFRRYPVPAFLENAFLTTDNKYANWYIRWTNGQSPRSFEDAPMPINRRLAHELQFVPANLDIPEALRWAQARSIGATPHQAMLIVQAFAPVQDVMTAAENRPVDGQHPQVFAESVIRFLVGHQAIQAQDYGPIIDYVFDAKYGVTRDHSQLVLEIKRPDYSMKGRTPVALIRDVNEWHREMRLSRLYQNLPQTWNYVNIPNFEHAVGIGEKSILFTIRQLNRQRSLFAEGTAMSHCVASYIGKCVRGDCSIWSMEMHPVCGNVSKLLTIEINRDKAIVQARGKCNRLPSGEEIRLIRIWMMQAGLKSLVF